MKIIDAQQAEPMENAHEVDVRSLHSTEHVQTVMITLQPTESLKLHVTPVDAFFYVLEGEGVVEIGDEQETIRTDHLVHSPAKVPHRLWNESDAVFRFLVVKTPHQTQKSRLL